MPIRRRPAVPIGEAPMARPEQLAQEPAQMERPLGEPVPPLPTQEGLAPAGRPRMINIEQLRTAQGLLEKYKDGKANLDRKIIENEDWWKMNHFRNFRRMKYLKNEETGEIQPVHDHPQSRKQSAWLFNSIMNKHADIMDNYPEPAILPREQTDEEAAKVLSSILPVIMENCDFEAVYSDSAWDKLCSGAAIYSVLWNSELQNGLGDIEIKQVDLLQFYWEPGVQDIQDSQNIFLPMLIDNKVLENQYPQLKGKLIGTGKEVKEYNYDDSVDTTNKSIVVDWYYKTQVGSKTTLQYVKWVNDEILYSSEDDESHPEYREQGYYNHGQYPFVMDVLFREKGTPAGFGYIDVMKSTQEDIDEMKADFRENARWGARPRYFSRDENGINQREFQDLDQQIVHVAGSIDDSHIRPIETKDLSGNYLTIYQSWIDELKETSGNRDFSQGSTAAGVTSGSAIAALQEAGSKGSRDMIKGSYRAYTEVCKLVIELMRQFYDTPRTFRIVGEKGQQEFVEFNNASLQGQPMNIMGEDFHTKEPIFDVKVKAQRSNPYSRLSQNELALQFYNLGFFNPQLSDQALATIEMMDFEGKEKVRERIQTNGTMYEQLQQMQQTMGEMAQLLANTTGDTRILQAMQAQGGGGQPLPQAEEGAVRETDRNSYGEPVRRGNSQADKMRERIQESAEVK